MNFLNLLELESLARQKLPVNTFDYYRGGAGEEITLHNNRAAYEKWSIHYRILVDVAQCNPTTFFLGTSLAFPVMIAPTAFHKLAHEDGERATALAAKAAGIPYVVSSLSTCTLEEIGEASAHQFWFQLYVNKDRGFTRDLIQRASACGCQALVVTVDTPLWGRREKDIRNGFHLPPGLSAINLLGSDRQGAQKGQQGAGMGQAFDWMLDASLSWKDLEWLRLQTKLPVLIKGVCRADDARKAVDHGLSGIIVSNHGGRQLDSAPPTLAVLPEIADAVNKDIPILLDGGIRRGTDILKALALGAQAVLIGRPVLWALALGGQEGVEKMLTLLKAEFDLAMALAGCKRVEEITADLVR